MRLHLLKKISVNFVTVDSTSSIEAPHNKFHVAIGGKTPLYLHNKYDANMFGDMNTLYSTYDPIFWVHHSNIERFLFIWLQNYYQEHNSTYPDVLVNKANSDEKDPDSQNLMTLNLFPFPELKNFKYDTLPWRVDPNTFPSFTPDMVGTWISNDALPYTYDVTEEDPPAPTTSITAVAVGGPCRLKASIVQTIQNVRQALKSLRVKGVMYRIRVSGADLRGTGTFDVIVNINGRDIVLEERNFILASRDQICLMCDNRSMTVAWDINVEKLGIASILGNEPSISLVSATYTTARGVENFSNLTVKMEKLPEEIPLTIAPPLIASLLARRAALGFPLLTAAATAVAGRRNADTPSAPAAKRARK